jgi:hypothetical protein
MLVVQLDPPFDIREGALGGNVKDDECAVCVLEVPRDETAKAFLPGGVPQLQAVVLGVVGDVLGEEVDSDCGLRKREVRWRSPRSDR